MTEAIVKHVYHENCGSSHGPSSREGLATSRNLTLKRALNIPTRMSCARLRISIARTHTVTFFSRDDLLVGSVDAAVLLSLAKDQADTTSFRLRTEFRETS